MSLVFYFPLNSTVEFSECSGSNVPKMIAPDRLREMSIYSKTGVNTAVGTRQVPLQGYTRQHFTMSFWYRHDGGNYTQFTGYENDDSGHYREFTMFVYPSASDFHISDTWGFVTVAYGVLRVGDWNHICIVVDGNNIKQYVNGSKVIDINQSNNQEVFQNNYPLIGIIQDFKYWDECLNDRQIKQEAKGLICHFNFSAGICSGQENILGNISGVYANGGAISYQCIRPHSRYMKYQAVNDWSPWQGAYFYIEGNPDDGVKRSTSFDYRVITPDGRTLHGAYYGWENQWGYGETSSTDVESGKWYHFHGTHIGSANAFTMYNADTVPANTVFEIKHIKIETGLQETNWRPNHITWSEGELATALNDHVILNRVIGHRPFYMTPKGKEYSSNGMIDSKNIRKDGYGTWYVQEGFDDGRADWAFETNDFTMQFVVDIDPSLGGRQEFLFSTGDGWVHDGVAMWFDPGGTISNVLLTQGDSTTEWSGVTVPVDGLYGNQHVLTIRYDYYGKTFSSWIDGKKVGESSVPSSVVYHDRLELMRGYFAYITGNDERMYGYISDFKFWATALSDTEIMNEVNLFRPHADDKEFYVPLLCDAPLGCNIDTKLNAFGIYRSRSKNNFIGLRDDFTKNVIADENSLKHLTWSESEQAYYAANYWESSVYFNIDEYSIYTVEIEMRCTNANTTDSAYIGIRTCGDYNCNHILTDRTERTSTPSTDPWDTYCMIHYDSNYKKMIFHVIGSKTSLNDIPTYYCEEGNVGRCDLALRPDRYITTNIQCRSNWYGQEYYIREFRITKLR